MRNSVADQWAKSIFEDLKFQTRWKTYMDMFGENINALFADDYRAKVHLAEALSKMVDGDYETAASKIKGYIKMATLKEDEQVLQRLVDICQSRIESKPYPQVSETYAKYRKRILSNDFMEATDVPGSFFRKVTEKTVFVVNLTDEDACITVVYGLAFIAFEQSWLLSHGVDDVYCQLRQLLVISAHEEEAAADQIISDYYQKYHSVEKDQLLALKKEKQTEFLNHFNDALKPLGFKKRGATWTRPLEQGYAVVFNAQKSAYSDQYYFNLQIKPMAGPDSIRCYDTRVVMYGRDLYNWQLMSQKQIQNLLDYTLEQKILPIIHMPLEDLGKKDYICKSCLCDRKICVHCWVQHNLWGR